MSIENARTLPVSAATRSCAWSVQVPLAVSPAKAASGENGENVPVNGFWAAVTFMLLTVMLTLLQELHRARKSRRTVTLATR